MNFLMMIIYPMIRPFHSSICFIIYTSLDNLIFPFIISCCDVVNSNFHFNYTVTNSSFLWTRDYCSANHKHFFSLFFFFFFFFKFRNINKLFFFWIISIWFTFYAKYFQEETRLKQTMNETFLFLLNSPLDISPLILMRFPLLKTFLKLLF